VGARQEQIRWNDTQARHSLQLSNYSNVHHLRAAADGYGLDLMLRSAKPPAIQGSGGVSQKSAGQGHASHDSGVTPVAAGSQARLPEKQPPAEPDTRDPTPSPRRQAVPEKAQVKKGAI